MPKIILYISLLTFTAKKGKSLATSDNLQRSSKAACFLLGVFQCLNSVIKLSL